MKWQPRDAKDSQVTYNSGWIKKTEVESLKEEPGIYIFADRNRDVTYVGRASYSVRKRVKDHLRDGRDGKAGRASLVMALYARDLEADLIAKYQPTNNINGTG